jgi:hypothetical protein
VKSFDDEHCCACRAGLPLVWHVQSKKMMHQAQGLSVTSCAVVDARAQRARDTRTSVAADSTTEWKHDLGQGRQIVMGRSSADYHATFSGFRGSGSTQELAIDDLLACMRRYCEEADDFQRSMAPGGLLLLHEKLRQLSALVDQIVENRGNEDQRGR